MTVLYVLVAVAVLLGALARLTRIYPNRPLALLALAPGILSIGLVARPALLGPLLALDGVLAALALADLATLPRRRSFAVARQLGRIASLGKPHKVSLVVSNLSRRGHVVWLRDGLPEEFAADRGEFVVHLRARNRAVLAYQATARRRGAFTIEAAYLRARSFGGLWQRHLRYAVESRVDVFPDMRQLDQYALLARTDRLSLVGVRRTRRIGQDNEFERLRDYTPDDNYRQIDWRSTARRHKLTVKDFQTNQSQRLVLLIDCGRMMTGAADDGLSLLDHALNSMLMLSYVALRQNDSVGLLCFSDEIHAYVPPRAGMQQMNKLLHASFDRFGRLVESRYDLAFLRLGAHCRKRSLVVLITNVIDEVNANQVHQYLSSLVGRHLPLGVMLRDRQLFDAADAPTTTDATLCRAAAAADILTWRRQVLRDLAAQGVLLVDTFPEGLTAPLVNRYLEVKARHLL